MKGSQGHAVWPKLLRLFAGQCFHLGGVLIHRSVTQPPERLALMNFNLRRHIHLDPARS